MGLDNSAAITSTKTTARPWKKPSDQFSGRIEVRPIECNQIDKLFSPKLPLILPAYQTPSSSLPPPARILPAPGQPRPHRRTTILSTPRTASRTSRPTARTNLPGELRGVLAPVCGHAEIEIGKWRPETGARSPPTQGPKCQKSPVRTGAAHVAKRSSTVPFNAADNSLTLILARCSLADRTWRPMQYSGDAGKRDVIPRPKHHDL
jgi:hypothetical protein